VRTVTLFIPSLFWPKTGATAAYDGLRLPALETLLCRGNVADSACENEFAWLCGRFGVQKQADWPVAPLAFAGDGGKPGAAYWLHADPVHLRVHNDGLILLAPDILKLDANEARALTTALNRQFEAEGLVFHASHPRRWYLAMPEAPRIRTVTLKEAIGREVNRLLPQGEERLRWHRIFNEVQMLLHAHPVNTAREERGATPVNSLWFWGGGTLPASTSPFDAIQSDDPVMIGVATLAGIIPVQRSGESGLAAGINALVDIRDAEHAFLRGNMTDWRNALETLDRRRFAPVLEALRSGRIGKAVVATVAEGRRYEWSVTRGDSWHIWKRPRPLAHHARNVGPERNTARLA
jgi:hypothetical protein